MHVFQYWHSQDIPNYIAPLLESFRRHNPRAQYAVFDAATAEALIASCFSAREVQAFRACRVPAMQADYFRYCAVLAYGGVYIDADMKCVGDLEPLFSYDFGDGALFRRANEMIMNAFFLFRRPDSPFLRLVLEVATSNIENRVAEDVWLVTGPGIFTYLDHLHREGSFSAFEQLMRADDYGPMVRFGDLMCRTIGSFERLRSAFQDILILHEKQMIGQVVMPGMTFPYKETNVHWTRVEGSIFNPSSLR